MSNVYLCSDWHLGHKNIVKHRQWADTEAEHAQILLDAYAETVTKNDLVWFLGDILFDTTYLPQMKALPGRKKLVMGNHDFERGGKFPHLAEVFDEVCALRKYKKVWLTHAPLHPNELRGRINIHGHMHKNKLPDDRYINVCPEHVGIYPVEFKKLVKGKING